MTLVNTRGNNPLPVHSSIHQFLDADKPMWEHIRHLKVVDWCGTKGLYAFSLSYSFKVRFSIKPPLTLEKIIDNIKYLQSFRQVLSLFTSLEGIENLSSCWVGTSTQVVVKSGQVWSRSLHCPKVCDALIGWHCITLLLLISVICQIPICSTLQYLH